jgi:hypothetical protein
MRRRAPHHTDHRALNRQRCHLRALECIRLRDRGERETRARWVVNLPALTALDLSGQTVMERGVETLQCE